MVGGAGLEPASLAASDPKSDVSANFTTRPVSWMWGRFYAIGPIEVKDNAQRTLRGRFARAISLARMSGDVARYAAMRSNCFQNAFRLTCLALRRRGVLSFA